MRLALITAAGAAAIAVPWAISIARPQMDGDQFLQAVRCTAIADLTQPGAELGVAKMHLNAEARRQPAETAARAEAEVRALARGATAPVPCDGLPPAWAAQDHRTGDA